MRSLLSLRERAHSPPVWHCSESHQGLWPQCFETHRVSDVSKCCHGIAMPATARLLCMGLFSEFWLGARARLAPARPQANLDALLIDDFRFQHHHRYQAIHANAGASAVNTGVPAQLRMSPTRLRVHWAPGIPRTLFDREGHDDGINSGQASPARANRVSAVQEKSNHVAMIVPRREPGESEPMEMVGFEGNVGATGTCIPLSATVCLCQGY